jgi:basic amino acid/polyamine antiporter, APA family
MSAELKRSLSLYALVMIAAGSSIGSGIFRTPGYIASIVHQPGYVLGIWVLGGVVALTGALTFAEISSRFPDAGGSYLYLREAYGNAVGFLYGWFILFVSTSGAIAALAVVCSEHVLYLLGMSGVKEAVVPLAVGITVFLSVINVFGVQVGEWVANIFTGAKLLGLLMIIVVGWLMLRPEVIEANATSTFANMPLERPFSAFALAFVGVLWSYGGWQHASFMAGETPNPQRNIPLAMVIGATVVTLVYVLANLAYMRLLPLEQLAASRTAAADALSAHFSWGGTLMAFLIALSTFGTTGIYSMTAPRLYYAMARDGIFFEKLAWIHPRWKTPMYAIFLQAGWSVLLIFFWGTFENLIEYVTFIDFLGSLVIGTTIFVFRRRYADASPFRTPLYPIIPVVFIAICAWFVLFTIVENPVRAWAGIGVVFTGWLAYYFYFKKRARV